MIEYPLSDGSILTHFAPVPVDNCLILLPMYSFRKSPQETSLILSTNIPIIPVEDALKRGLITTRYLENCLASQEKEITFLNRIRRS